MLGIGGDNVAQIEFLVSPHLVLVARMQTLSTLNRKEAQWRQYALQKLRSERATQQEEYVP